jgi:transcriptional regulator with XRE-family HTH domain
MDQLAELRERRALTLRELAEMSGVAADTINQIELGHRKPRPSTLRKLARALVVNVEELMPPKKAKPRARRGRLRKSQYSTWFTMPSSGKTSKTIRLSREPLRAVAHKATRWSTKTRSCTTCWSTTQRAI